MRWNIFKSQARCRIIQTSSVYPVVKKVSIDWKPHSAKLCTFHHHLTKETSFQVNIQNIKSVMHTAQANRCCIDKSWALFDNKWEVCECRVCHRKRNQDTEPDNKGAILRKCDDNFRSFKCRRILFSSFFTKSLYDNWIQCLLVFTRVSAFIYCFVKWGTQ